MFRDFSLVLSAIAAVSYSQIGLTQVMPPRLPSEGAGAYAPPNARFESAPQIGEPVPDVMVVDREGNPVNIREVASEHYTVLVLGCLT